MGFEKIRAPYMHRHDMKFIDMNLSLINFHLMSLTIFREITSHYGDDHSIKKYLAGVKTDLWSFIRFLEITSRYDKHNFLSKSNE